ncbi:MAG: hypothetical protein QOC94_2760 [Actinoplanes sp.]|nr:hypothetical protein [Actinoplanes sp.]MDT5032589.1 hypothetical protein [Actinoplanes sp.]
MTVLPAPAAGPPSRTAVRRAGDHYQDLVTWCCVLRALLPGSTVTQLEIEVDGAGNVDDVVQRHAAPPHRYSQLKYAVRAEGPINTGYLLTRQNNGTSLLEKFYASWTFLGAGPVAPAMELVTNRAIDPSDELLRLCDGRSDLLLPAARLAPLRSGAGKLVTEWAAHLQVDRDDLLAMLEHLVFRTGRTVSAERERAEALMLAAGLRADETALRLGTATVAEWVRQGRRVLPVGELADEVEALGLRIAEPRAVLLLQAIDRDPHPDDATVALDWVDLYDGDEPAVRRSPKNPEAWHQMSTELDAATSQLRASGHRDVLVRGAMRLGTFFAVGARLAQVTGINVHYARHGTMWSSTAPRTHTEPLRSDYLPLDQGDDLAIAIAITIDPTEAVARHLRQTGTPVRGLLTLRPAEGPHDQAVTGPGHGVTLAQELRNAVRGELERRPAARVHLFQAGPGGLAFLTGHRWNRVAPTLLYEDLGPGLGYVHAFTIAA